MIVLPAYNRLSIVSFIKASFELLICAIRIADYINSVKLSHKN